MPLTQFGIKFTLAVTIIREEGQAEASGGWNKTEEVRSGNRRAAFGAEEYVIDSNCYLKTVRREKKKKGKQKVTSRAII